MLIIAINHKNGISYSCSTDKLDKLSDSPREISNKAFDIIIDIIIREKKPSKSFVYELFVIHNDKIISHTFMVEDG